MVIFPCLLDDNCQMVAPAGIEPATHGASIRCSTYWATEPLWRSRRESNPRSPPWQGGVVNHFTTGPYGCGGRIRTYDLRIMSPTSCQLLHSAIKNWWELKEINKRTHMAGNEGFEPPRAVKPLVVFKTTPFSQTWVIALGGPSWTWTSNLPVMSRVL